MTTITTTAVAPNELIESSWGNAVRTDLTNLNTDKVALAGGTLTGQLNGITPTSAANLTRKDYVDGFVAGLVSAAGDTMTGSLTISTSGQGVNLPAGEPSSAGRAARKDYVDTLAATKLSLTGGTLTSGSITIAGSGQGVNLPTGEPTSAARAARKDYVDNAVNARVATAGDTMTGLLTANSGVVVPSLPGGVQYATSKYYVDGGDSLRVASGGDRMSGDLFVGSGDGYDSAAVDLSTSGQILSHMATAGVGNMALSRSTSGGIAAGQGYIYFRRSGTVIGSVIISTSTSVAYVTTSDPRSKVRTGDAAGVVDRVQLLGRKAFRGHAVGDKDDREWVFLSSHDVEDVFPELVHGPRDGNEMQQVNFPGMVPALCAALSNALDRIDALEGAVR